MNSFNIYEVSERPQNGQLFHPSSSCLEQLRHRRSIGVAQDGHTFQPISIADEQDLHTGPARVGNCSAAGVPQDGQTFQPISIADEQDLHAGPTGAGDSPSEALW